MKPLLVIVSSPSGAGKTTILRALLKERSDMGFAISATTRLRRARERDGVDYHFLTPDDFQRSIERDEFAEWAEYGGARYGTPQSELDRLHNDGKHAILDIDIQGARSLRAKYTDAVSIFILPPSAEVLHERLTARGTEDQAALKRRLARAITEIGEATSYDYLIVNDVVASAVTKVQAIVDAESLKPLRQPWLTGELRQLTDGLETLAKRLGP